MGVAAPGKGEATSIARSVPLAPMTSLELGGVAEHFVTLDRDADLGALLQWARERELAVTVLGGGSNVVVPDAGVPGLTVRIATSGVRTRVDGDVLRIEAAAGERWDDIVRLAVASHAAGVECLSGIPGSVGATPIQNVGAYGQEVAEVIAAVRVFDRQTRAESRMAADACGFGYRTSVFKRMPGRHIVLGVEYALRLGAPERPRYAELARVVGDGAVDLAAIREAVIALRRGKSMVQDATDENRRSVGSFFTNPIVDAATFAEVLDRARAVAPGHTPPSWPQPGGRIKLAAAWLIEHSGTRRGERQGAVGVSSRHTLALVHHGGGTTSALLEFAARVASRVHTTFGVLLEREPVLLGVAPEPERDQPNAR